MDERFFQTIDSELKSYWLGFMFADGNVHVRKNGAKIINLSQKDTDVLVSFCDAFGSTQRLSKITNQWATSYRVQFRSDLMFDDLVNKGCVPRKSLILEPPLIDLGMYTRDFIRGYNDGDGGFYLKSRTMRVRGTVSFLEWMQTKLPSGSKIYREGPTAQLFVIKKSVLQETVKYLYEGATVYMPRK